MGGQLKRCNYHTIIWVESGTMAFQPKRLGELEIGDYILAFDAPRQPSSKWFKVLCKLGIGYTFSFLKDGFLDIEET